MDIRFKILILILIVVGIFTVGFNNQIFQGVAQEELPIFVKEEPLPRIPSTLYAPDEIIVKFKPGIAKNVIDNFLQTQGVSEKYESPFAKFKALKIPATKTVPELVEVFKKSPLVEYAEPNFIYCVLWYPDDPYYQYQWNFDDDHTKNPGGATSNPYGGANGGGIRMENAWPITNGTSSVIVAVVDTGIAYEDYLIPAYEIDTVKSGVTTYKKAPDLAGTNFVAGYDYMHNDNHPNDNNAHGTHVAGTIAQTTNNATGTAGIAYNTSIMPVKVLDQAGCGYLDDVADGINFATANGAKVINLSLGGSDSTTIKNAVINAYNSGVTVIAACGNSAVSSCSYPAAYDAYVIAVGATRYDETLSYYSSYGPSLDLVAPGGDLAVNQNDDGYPDGILQNTFTPYDDKPPYCVSPSDKKADPTTFAYYFFQGTSMATPHVVGVAALLLAQNPSRTPDQIRNILQNTAEDKGAAGPDNTYGYGIVDAYAALTYGTVVSITVTDNSTFNYGVLALSSSTSNPTKKNTVELNKTPVVKNTGDVAVDLAVKSTDATGGTTPWNLVVASSIGQNAYCHQYSTTSGSTWYDFPISNDYTGIIKGGLPVNNTTNLDLQILMPTGSTDITQKSITVTIRATQAP